MYLQFSTFEWREAKPRTSLAADLSDRRHFDLFVAFDLTLLASLPLPDPQAPRVLTGTLRKWNPRPACGTAFSSVHNISSVLSRCVLSLHVLSRCVLSLCVLSRCVLSLYVLSRYVLSLCVLSLCVLSVCVCCLGVCGLCVCVISVCVCCLGVCGLCMCCLGVEGGGGGKRDET